MANGRKTARTIEKLMKDQSSLRILTEDHEKTINQLEIETRRTDKLTEALKSTESTIAALHSQLKTAHGLRVILEQEMTTSVEKTRRQDSTIEFNEKTIRVLNKIIDDCQTEAESRASLESVKKELQSLCDEVRSRMRRREREEEQSLLNRAAIRFKLKENM